MSQETKVELHCVIHGGSSLRLRWFTIAFSLRLLVCCWPAKRKSWSSEMACTSLCINGINGSPNRPVTYCPLTRVPRPYQTTEFALCSFVFFRIPDAALNRQYYFSYYFGILSELLRTVIRLARSYRPNRSETQFILPLVPLQEQC